MCNVSGHPQGIFRWFSPIFSALVYTGDASFRSMQFNEVLMVVLFPVMMNVHPKKDDGQKTRTDRGDTAPGKQHRSLFFDPIQSDVPLTE